MVTKYYRAPGMMYPNWVTYQHQGITWVHNLEADTDMSDLTEDEFHELFPSATEVDPPHDG